MDWQQIRFIESLRAVLRAIVVGSFGSPELQIGRYFEVWDSTWEHLAPLGGPFRQRGGQRSRNAQQTASGPSPRVPVLSPRSQTHGDQTKVRSQCIFTMSGSLVEGRLELHVGSILAPFEEASAQENGNENESNGNEYYNANNQ